VISTQRRRVAGIGWAYCPSCGAEVYCAALWVQFRETRPLFVRAPAGPYVIDGKSTARRIASVGGKEAAGNDRWRRHTCDG
jgi:hypothetical protein